MNDEHTQDKTNAACGASALSAGLDLIAGSPEVARDMAIAGRNKRLADLMYDSLFQSELQAFRGALIEYRKHLSIANERAASDDLRNIGLVLLHRTDEFLKLLPIEGLAFFEWPSNPVKQEGRRVAGVTLVSGEENARRYGVHGAYIMENDFSGNRPKKIIESDASIDPTTARRKEEVDLRRVMLGKNVRHNSD